MMILPQEAAGYLMPSPRKLSVASDRITAPRSMVANTISWGTTLGTRCLKILRLTRTPVASVATMNSCSRSDKICPRTIRAIPTQPILPMITHSIYIRTVGLAL